MKNIIAAVSIIIIALVSSFFFFAPNKASASQSDSFSGKVEVRCMSLNGLHNLTFTGTEHSISWYSDGTYVDIKLIDRELRIPQHRCERTIYK